MAVKLDISKAYDRVEWEFLQQIMQKIGLPDQWVNLAMETMHTASYLTIINGEPRGFLTPTRGIKQGDLCLLTYSYYVQKGSPPSHGEL